MMRGRRFPALRALLAAIEVAVQSRTLRERKRDAEQRAEKKWRRIAGGLEESRDEGEEG